MNEKKAVILISGYNPRAVIAFCRWAIQHEINFHLIASSNSDPILLSKYADRVDIIRDSQELRLDLFLAWMKTIIHRYGYQQIMILPTTEYFNRFLLKHREVLENERCVVPLVEESLYLRISDKREFANLCKLYGLAIPDEYSVLPAAAPFVAKPRSYFNGEGIPIYPHLILNDKDHLKFMDNENPEDYFFQEFVDGENHYLLACIQKEGDPILFSQENLIQQNLGKSVILARASQYHLSENARKYITMLKAIGFMGLIMIEIRRTESGVFVMIEANPRLWGPIQYAIDNQVDIFGPLLEDCGYKISEHSEDKHQAEYYFWSGGINPGSQPLTFHNYSEREFIRDLHEIRKNDIYLRDDTMNIYLQEMGILKRV